MSPSHLQRQPMAPSSAVPATVTSAKVRAILRVRPPLPAEASDSCLQMPLVPGDTVRIGNPRNGQETLSFRFDRCYGQDASQLAIFAQDVAPLAERALAGYNVTIFAYGNTGAGKTFTMEGAPRAPGTTGGPITLIDWDRDDSSSSAVRAREPEEEPPALGASQETGRGENFLPRDIQRKGL